MSVASETPFSADIHAIRENYDTSNPVIAEIIKAKEQRLKILQELNKQHQDELDSTELSLKPNLKKEVKPKIKHQKKSNHIISPTTIRRSARLLNSPTIKSSNEVYKPEVTRSEIVRPPNDYGPMPGVEVGCWWETRMECSMYGVHRPTVAGIHGGPDGAYSIALSGGYPVSIQKKKLKSLYDILNDKSLQQEDVDEGDSFIYTGAGGRDLKGTINKPKNLRVAPQTKDQQLEGTNLSLVKSIESKLPIRVIRGYKSPSIFAPESGYRYDGLYQVVKYWEDVGKTGYKIYRFKMERIKNQAPPPWEAKSKTVRRRNNNRNQEFASLIISGDDNKENIRPSDYLNYNSTNINMKDVTDFEYEIQMCINFFCNTSKGNSDLQNNGSEEEFLGWEEQ